MKKNKLLFAGIGIGILFSAIPMIYGFTTHEKQANVEYEYCLLAYKGITGKKSQLLLIEPAKNNTKVIAEYNPFNLEEVQKNITMRESEVARLSFEGWEIKAVTSEIREDVTNVYFQRIKP